MQDTSPKQPATTPPAFNLPSGVLYFAAVLTIVHTAMALVPQDRLIETLATFAFIPFTYGLDPARLFEPAARYWSPLTYGFLHADWTHLGTNIIWLVAFGSPVAKRFGTARFFALIAVSIAAGAAAHYIAHPDDNGPLVGASGAVSAFFGAAARFAFTPGAFNSDARLMQPARGLVRSLTTPTVFIFVAIWLVVNWIFGSGLVPVAGEGISIAWEAHLGGFLVGLLAFPLFDPVRPLLPPSPDDPSVPSSSGSPPR